MPASPLEMVVVFPDSRINVCCPPLESALTQPKYDKPSAETVRFSPHFLCPASIGPLIVIGFIVFRS